MDELVIFRSAIELLKEKDMKYIIETAYRKAKEQLNKPKNEMINAVKEIYAPFTDEELSQKMVELLRPDEIHAEIEVVFQPLQGLLEACPNHTGDWYFSGDYPTQGGVKLVNKAFIKYVEDNFQF